MSSTADLARKIRIHSVQMTSRGGSSHVAACLSIADILAVLYGSVLKHSPSEPADPGRDRFFLSKGHAGAAVYATLAELGYFSPSQLVHHYQNGSIFSGHVSHKGIPGVELSTGSLGHALSVAAGMAYGAKLDSADQRYFALLSDGECDEGSNWEAILFAAHHKLENLVAIVDYNKIQSLGPVSETLGLEPFRAKWESFGWEVIEVDGHDHTQLKTAFMTRADKPICVICHTVKGRGVSFMENSVLWHYRTARNNELDAALNELADQK